MHDQNEATNISQQAVRNALKTASVIPSENLIVRSKGTPDGLSTFVRTPCLRLSALQEQINSQESLQSLTQEVGEPTEQWAVRLFTAAGMNPGDYGLDWINSPSDIAEGDYYQSHTYGNTQRYLCYARYNSDELLVLDGDVAKALDLEVPHEDYEAYKDAYTNPDNWANVVTARREAPSASEGKY